MLGDVALNSLHSLVPDLLCSLQQHTDYLLQVVCISMCTAACKHCGLGVWKTRLCSLLTQEGLIINLGSVAALEPMKSTPVYAASKWGLRGWSLSCYEVILRS